jgi:uncharacterized protein
MDLHRDQKELLVIETADFSLYMKGVPYDKRYFTLSQYRQHVNYEQEKMVLRYNGVDVESVEVFDAHTNSLKPFEEGPFSPIFFENGIYQLVITPKTDEPLKFYHEHPGIRKAVTPVGKHKNPILMGQLDFKNEIGYSTFSILKNNESILEVTIEIYPSKLSYKEDFQNLLQEVNDEIYNLAFHFIKKTYLTGESRASKNPTASEFFRLIEYYFHSFAQAIQQIERQPHHTLQKEYEVVRADRIRKVDQHTKKYLRKHAHLFVEVDNGLYINGNHILPEKGMNVKKTLTYNTLENRFVKWMVSRIVYKLGDLIWRLEHNHKKFNIEVDKELFKRIHTMKHLLEHRMRRPFWAEISKIDRTVLNLVMQMKVGYRDLIKSI